MRHSLIFVATTPFAVNAFLRSHLLALAQAYEVTLCVNMSAYPLVDEISRVVSVRHIDIERKVSLVRDVKALFQLLRCINKVKPTVVHSLTPKAGLLGMLAAWLMGVPLRFHTFTGQVWANKSGISRFLMKRVDRLITICSSRVFADSVSQCRFLREEKVVRNDEIEMLGSGSIAGVDFRRFHPDISRLQKIRQNIGSNECACIYLFVGRLALDKGVFDLVEAFRKVAAVVGNVELWVIGPDEENLLHSLQKNSQLCDAPIRWLGATPTPEIFMSAADILLLPSYREGFGSVIIEAAACGIPTIAYRINGVVDALVEGSGGILVDVGDSTAFAAAMELVALDTELRLRLGDNARQRALRYFGSEMVTKAWLEFYHGTLNNYDEAFH